MARGRPSKRKAVKGENGENGIVDAADPPAKRSAPTKREKPVTEPARRSTRGKKQEETNGHTKEPAPIVEEVPVTKKGRGRGRKPKQVEEEIEKAPENGHPAEDPVEETPEAETEDKSEESPVSEDPEEPAADEEAQEEKEVAGNGDSEVEAEEEKTEKQNGDVSAAESEAPPSADEKEDEEKVDEVDDDEKEAVKDAEEEEKEAPAGADDLEEEEPEAPATASSPAENDEPEEEAINGKIILSIEHCKSAKVYSKSATDLIEALKAEFGEVEVTVNGKKPRSKSFEINLITPDDTSVSVWTGVKKAPQKAKFPDSSLIIEEIRKHI